MLTLIHLYSGVNFAKIDGNSFLLDYCCLLKVSTRFGDKMNPPHPMVARIEEEHNYARPWFKKLNSPQRYPNRIARFLFLKNFPRHFLSKSPFAFLSKHDGTLDVGSPKDLQFKKEPVENETENTDEDFVEQETMLDTSTWTQQKDRLYYKIFQILQQYYLTKLVYENRPNSAVRMVNLMENTCLQLRHSFANIAGWDNQLLIWLHNLFIQKIPSHEHLISIYHEVMRSLNKRIPSLIEKFYSVDDEPEEIIEKRLATPRRLTSNPLILLVPCGPSIPSQPISERMEYWKTLLSSMGQLININIPYRPDQMAPELLQVIKTSVRDKIRDVRKKKFNELRPLVLVGFNQGSLIAIHCALENPGQVSAIVCLGFPLSSINGFRGDLDDPMQDMSIPILFVVGQMASTATLDALERLRESMHRCDTGLVVVGGANDKLIVSYKKKLYDGITQYHVDKSIADEIYEFVNSINMQQPDFF